MGRTKEILLNFNEENHNDLLDQLNKQRQFEEEEYYATLARYIYK
jgi:hypothetical protein